MSPSSRRNRELKLLTASIFLSWLALAAVYLAKPYIDMTIIISAGLVFAVLYISDHLILRFFRPYSEPILLPLICLLTGLGLAMIYRLSQTLVIYQFLWVVIGNIVFMLLILVVDDYRTLAGYKYSLGLIGLILLVSTIRFGSGFFEPNLWLKIGPLSFQPSEIAKLLVVIFFAAYLSEKHELLSIFTRQVGRLFVPDVKHLGPLLVFWAISVGLLVIQKDLGASLLFFGLFLTLLYIATDRILYVAIGSFLFLIGATGAALALSYVNSRIQIWINPWQDVSGKGYQLVQSLFAFGSGGFWGSGLGRGFPNLIPAVSTDFIFSAFGEEIGLIGVVALIAIYIVLVARGFKIALKTDDEFGKLLAAGLTVVFAIQTFVIIGGVSRVVPLTGITLPFLSYGGSSILANFILFGLLILVSNQQIEEASQVS